ncbi:potassium-transporting ATPase subunit KdpC [Inquilinus limosus]|uniref:Potassium-transporting ATPase KdpC subunit n=1 Tax=Inquilinus limosus MP06 TaxID=1398085 RepID=A0A0A0D844_9PROT|nr:potassium-transporting ATPase subunit KdpC [Inquilinus limosus]KGM34304.1 potassium-transporting ATPase subunit C [Inquilinus limosus MP06]
MLNQIRPAIVMIVLLTILTGIAYPFAMTGVTQGLFPSQANGSLVKRADGTVIGAALIGQNFTSEKYFHGRISATSGADPNDPTQSVAQPYNAANSAGSNLGPTSQALSDRVKGDVDALAAQGIKNPPADMVTSSASGLDPDISPANAELQVARVAAARNLPADKVRQLVQGATSGRLLGLIGEPRVNVLQLNMALDGLTTP